MFLSTCCGLLLPSNGHKHQLTAALGAPAALTSSIWGCWWGQRGRWRWGWRWLPEEPRPFSPSPGSNPPLTRGCCCWRLERERGREREGERGRERESERGQRVKLQQSERRNQGHHLFCSVPCSSEEKLLWLQEFSSLALNLQSVVSDLLFLIIDTSLCSKYVHLILFNSINYNKVVSSAIMFSYNWTYILY